MRCFNQGVFRQQVRFLRHQYLQDGDLPFSNVLSEEVVVRSLTAIKTCWLDVCNRATAIDHATFLDFFFPVPA